MFKMHGVFVELSLLGSAKSRVLLRLVAGGRTAIEVGDLLRIRVSATRKHLEELKAAGLVESRFERAARGRPKKVYVLTDTGRELFPRRYDDVLNALIAQVVTERGPTVAESLMNSVAIRLSPTNGTRAIVRALNELGFEASTHRQAGSLTITSRNCPILKVAQAHREVVCRGLHEGLLRRGTSGTVRRERWIVDGDSVCTHVVT